MKCALYSPIDVNVYFPSCPLDLSYVCYNSATTTTKTREKHLNFSSEAPCLINQYYASYTASLSHEILPKNERIVKNYYVLPD